MERNFFPDGQMTLLILTYHQSNQFRGANSVDEETTRKVVKLKGTGQSENFPPRFTDLVTGFPSSNVLYYLYSNCNHQVGHFHVTPWANIYINSS